VTGGLGAAGGGGGAVALLGPLTGRWVTRGLG
jgi:hypothetical protein